jgi:protein TonB
MSAIAVYNLKYAEIMELKKSKKADIERHKLSYFSIGMIVALSMALIAFEWSSAPGTNHILQIEKSRPLDSDIIPNTKEKIEPVAKPVTPPDIIEIVVNTTDIPIEINFGTDIIKPGDSIDYSNLYTPEIDEPEDNPVVIVSEMPGFRGGNLNDFSAWVQKNIKYPAVAASIGIEEKIYITFVVERDGTVSSTEILRGIDNSLKEEVLRVMAKSPKWTPGSNMGRPARVRFSMVVNFKLE